MAATNQETYKNWNLNYYLEQTKSELLKYRANLIKLQRLKGPNLVKAERLPQVKLVVHSTDRPQANQISSIDESYKGDFDPNQKYIYSRIKIAPNDADNFFDYCIFPDLNAIEKKNEYLINEINSIPVTFKTNASNLLRGISQPAMADQTATDSRMHVPIEHKDNSLLRQFDIEKARALANAMQFTPHSTMLYARYTALDTYLQTPNSDNLKALEAAYSGEGINDLLYQFITHHRSSLGFLSGSLNLLQLTVLAAVMAALFTAACLVMGSGLVLFSPVVLPALLGTGLVINMLGFIVGGLTCSIVINDAFNAYNFIDETPLVEPMKIGNETILVQPQEKNIYSGWFVRGLMNRFPASDEYRQFRLFRDIERERFETMEVPMRPMGSSSPH